MLNLNNNPRHKSHLIATFVDIYDLDDHTKQLCLLQKQLADFPHHISLLNIVGNYQI